MAIQRTTLITQRKAEGEGEVVGTAACPGDGIHFGFHGGIVDRRIDGEEFVSADAIDAAGAFQVVFQNLGRNRDQAVTFLMTKVVIDILQIVDINDEETNLGRILFGLGNKFCLCHIAFIAVAVFSPVL